MNIGLMIVVAVIVGVVIYMEINKQLPRINEKELNPDMSRYMMFADKIDDEIDALRKGVLFGETKLFDSEKKDEFLEKLSSLRKELEFLQASHATNKNANIWEEKLAEFLAKFESVVEEYIKDGEAKNDEIRSSLQSKF
ncbi:hypothetical protein [Campylobacter corcagiensis]|uniref:Thioester dehydrase family protein n=1 Tax=Campylobacter corcagiensis TaxID=1448857 RepID=A0A7M1LEM2_9BACT|nr:hypothetical protein [Campylobacter corcagiensis]QKF64819.1 hypothetical protein CCORG_0966 [Campylobacter corcagiensis]QOQ87019.1 hypothetical protein IMC76_07345 [Campylobacter corcagiensis]